MNVTANNLAQTVLDFLMEDLDVAMRFLDVAETTQDREAARRNRESALRVYNIAVGKLREIRTTGQQRDWLNAKLRLLRMRLITVFQF